MSRLQRVRQVMAGVRKCELAEKPVTMTGVAATVGLPQSTVHQLITVHFPECFDVQPYQPITLTGVWPRDIAFDWETLEPLERKPLDEKFRQPAKAILREKASPKKINWAEHQEAFELFNVMFQKIDPANSIEFIVNSDRESVQWLYDRLTPVVEILRHRLEHTTEEGFLKDYFYSVTGLHYSPEKGKTAS